MSRTVESAMSTALQAQGQEIVWFIELEFSSGTLRLCTAQHDVSWSLSGSVMQADDNFTDTNGTAPASHTPDSGYGGWTELKHNDTGTYTLDIQSNKLSFLCGTAGAEKRFVLVSDNAVIPTTGSWEFRTTWTRDATATGSHKGGLSFYLDTTGVFTGTLGWPAGVHVWLEESDANNVRYRLFEGDGNGDAVQTVSDTTDIALSGAGSIDLGVTVEGASVTIWTEPAGGGTRTEHGTETLSTDFLGLGYRRVGPSGASASAANPTQTWDDCEFWYAEDTWTGIGGHLTLDAVEESSDRQAGVNVTLDGVDTSVIALVLGANYLGRQAKIYYGLIGSDGAIVEDPIQFGPYYMLSSWNVRETRSPNGQGTASVRGRLTSRLAPLTKVKGIVTNVRSHEKHYSGDLFFEFIPGLVGKRIIWGGQSSGLGGGGNRGGGGRNGGDELSPLDGDTLI